MFPDLWLPQYPVWAISVKNETKLNQGTHLGITLWVLSSLTRLPSLCLLDSSCLLDMYCLVFPIVPTNKNMEKYVSIISHK